MSIGKRLLKLRQEKGMSQEELAQQLHVSRQTISKWESDLSLPDMKMMMSLSDFFQVPITELLGIDDNQNSQDSIEQIYQQTKCVLDNLQKENERRKVRDWIIIGICLLSMLIVVYLFWINILSTRNKEIHQQIIQYPTIQQEEKSIVNFGHSYFHILSFDFDKKLMMVDCQYTLNTYKEKDQVDLVMIDQNDKEYIFPMTYEKGVFVYKGEIPIKIYSQQKLIVENEEHMKQTQFLSQENYLYQLFQNLIS
ncbi:MAG: helix-turn-helix domain-containing protein [Longibaculum sp.]